MSRILAIDFGRKRTGIAVTDTLRIIATGLATIPTSNIFAFLESYFEKEDVTCIVIGLPKQTNGTLSENGKRVLQFFNKIKAIYTNKKIVFCDERFTSVLAHKAMLEGGLPVSKRKNKALVDEISACIILQSYMESIRI